MEPHPLGRISTPQSASCLKWQHQSQNHLRWQQTIGCPSSRSKATSWSVTPDQFMAVEDWVPLYTLKGLEKHLPAALSAFASTEPPSLTAVVPPQICMGMDREFFLTNFHWHECLVRQSITIGRKHRQLAFCPYCGVVNENSETTLSHMRKHLDLLFVCGGCYAKSFPHGQDLNKHMRTMCHATSAIREKARAPRKWDSL